jgi:hypothetical protein
MFLRPGLIASDQVTTERFQPQLLPTRSLCSVVKDYVLFNPFVFNLCLPAAPIDLITESMRVVGFPSRHLCIRLPHSVFNYGHDGMKLGVPGNLVLAIPRDEWIDVRNFVMSISFLDPVSSNHVFLRLGELLIRDPFVSAARPIDDLAADTVSVQTLAIECGSRGFWLARTEHWPANPQYTFTWVTTGGDVRSAAACDMFIQGENNPLVKAENEHGKFDYGTSGSMVDDASHESSDGKATS